MLLAWRLKSKHHKPLSDQLLLHLSSTMTPDTPYAWIQEMYHLPYQSPYDFLKAHHITCKDYFHEHCAILSQAIKLKQLVISQLLPLLYPLTIFALSTMMFYGFRVQFHTLFMQMEASMPTNHMMIKMFHSVVLVLAVGLIGGFMWFNSAYYRAILCVQRWRKTRLGKLVYEWTFFQVVCALYSPHIVFQDVATIMRAHTKHPIMSIMAYEIKEHCEQGHTLNDWISQLTTSQTMAHWIVEQLKTHKHSQLKHWHHQLLVAIQHHVASIKLVITCGLYMGIGLNIIGMLALLATPYRWINI